MPLPHGHSAETPLETVSYVDLNRYLGTWYEIARFDHRFQRDCKMSWAEYQLQSNGEIKVLNQCFTKAGNGQIKKAEGVAWVVNKKTNAKLKVQFFLPFLRLGFLAGDYWIIDLDEDNYSYAVVGDPSREYLWILSRSKIMSEELYQELVARAREKGFETTRLIRTSESN